MDTFETMLAGFLLFYVLGILILGFIVRKRAEGLSGFLVAKRKLPTLFTTLSLSASILGASMTFISIGLVYSNGLSGMWFTLGPAVFLFIMGVFLAKKIRKSKALTLSDLIGQMFDTKTRVVSAFLVVFAEIAWVALLALTAQGMLVFFLGMSETWSLVLILVVFTLYTFIAGKVADAYTDVIQFIMMVAMIAILLVVTLQRDTTTSISGDQLNLFGGGLSLTQIIGFFLLLGLPYLVGPDVYSAILSAKSEKVARRSAIFGSAIILGWGAVMAILGLLGYAILGPNASPNSVIVVLIFLVENPALKAFLVGGLIAVLMSSLDTTLLTGSSTISNDIFGPIYEKVVKPDEKTKDKVLLYVAKGSAVFLALAAFGIAMWYQDIVDTLKLAYTVFVSGMILPVVAGLFKKQTKVTTWQHGEQLPVL